MDAATVKAELEAYIEEQMDQWWEFSLGIHADPEIAFEEYRACEKQVRFLRENGFDVEEKAGGVETAYRATYTRSPGELNIAIVSEYDALPGLGHACGHNLICTSALGTALATKKFMDDHDIAGTLTVMGTPAEESGGGKIIMLENGAFEGIDAILFMHPTSDKTRLAGACLSSYEIDLEFIGKPAHAESHPEDGISALNAANVYFVASGLIRQHFKSDARLTGIITAGGEGKAMVPDYVHVEGFVSCFSLSDLEMYAERIRKCAEGAALATGCEVTIRMKPGYQGRVPNEVLSLVCRKELEEMGEPLLPGMPHDYGGEDLGNVSRFIPICNPYVTIFPDYKISGHTPQFRELASSPAGRRCIEVTSKALSRTAVELFLHPELVDQAKAELSERMKED